MTEPSSSAEALKRLVDKEAIRDCLYKYCRGIDRADERRLRSTDWPDGTDDHGPYSGPVMGHERPLSRLVRRTRRRVESAQSNSGI